MHNLGRVPPSLHNGHRLRPAHRPTRSPAGVHVQDKSSADAQCTRSPVQTRAARLRTGHRFIPARLGFARGRLARARTLPPCVPLGGMERSIIFRSDSCRQQLVARSFTVLRVLGGA